MVQNELHILLRFLDDSDSVYGKWLFVSFYRHTKIESPHVSWHPRIFYPGTYKEKHIVRLLK